MSTRRKDRPTHVARCVRRQDGQWLVLTLDGQNAVSPIEIPEGASVVVSAGKAERQNHG